ncbi:SAM-dependent methyltransferase [Micromonospora sp. WMMD1128]|uniref:SAM-dependent methyltransferase n=1 Tax=unclassified Micromonospora TaxID=2617518 RepID=UPI00248D28CC|nr:MULTISPECIES: SAM-dependent methyltransferase [unclassified Micromonospora]WBB72263.1 SAM-dependent methyltransferase [Micromonospora sp. WMMD1128]WFE34279.1 SAM-dependent methyltransferase [Micromonospora sp. WMMD975]
MQTPDGLPAEIDLTRPSAARVYDYFLGGAHNFEIDRQLAEQIASMTPNLAATMRAGREFLRRAVRVLLDAGIDQFLDIGSGIPTVGNVHEVAQAANPQARIVYVDIDPVAVAHSRELLAGNERATAILADLREPKLILDQARASGLIDFDRPVGILLAGVVHFVPDADRPADVLATLRSVAAEGSYLVISHSTFEDQPQEMLDAQRLSARTATEITLRSRAEVTGFFGDWTILEPGVVHMPLWRPDSPSDVDEHPERFGAFGGVARHDRAAG